jgi:hypothetical protein
MPRLVYYAILVLTSASFADVAISNVFTIGGYLTGEYEVFQSEAQKPDGTTSKQWATEFHQQYFNFMFNGRPADHVEFRGNLAFGQTQRVFGVEEGWVTYEFARALKIQAGKYLVPFGTFNQLHSPMDNVFVTTPLIMQFIAPSPWSDLGACLKGSVGFSRTQAFSYALFVGNGLGEGSFMSTSGQNSENNLNKGMGGRIAFIPIGGLEVGGSGYYDIFDNLDSQAYTLFGGDLSLVALGFELKGEYCQGKIENPSIFGDGRIKGFYAQLGYTIARVVQPHVRYDQGRYKDNFHGLDHDLDGIPDGINLDNTWYCGGIAIFPTPFLVFKFEYDRRIDKPTDLYDDQGWVQAGISF